MKNGISDGKTLDWGLDGVTLPPHAPFNLTDLNVYVRQQTGLKQVTYVEKSFDPEHVLWDVIEQRKEMSEGVILMRLLQVCRTNYPPFAWQKRS